MNPSPLTRSADISRRQIPSSTWIVIAIATLAIGTLAAGCVAPDRRFERLTELASTEVRSLPNALDRLGRFLQIANLQQNRGVAERARASRADAQQVLENAVKEDLAIEPQLAGWISLAELGRDAEAADESRLACERAHVLLLTLEPPALRVPYVRSLAHELQFSQNGAAAVDLYCRAAEWASGIEGPRKRRTAYLAISHSLVDLNEVEKAAGVIRRESEAGWRAQALIALAGGDVGYQYSAQRSAFSMAPQRSQDLVPIVGDIPAAGSLFQQDDQDFSWKAIDYGSYFRSK